MTVRRVHRREVRFDETYTRPPAHPNCRPVFVDLDEQQHLELEARLSLDASRARRRRRERRRTRLLYAGLALEAAAFVALGFVV